jgi:hypothetical protein
MGSLTVEEKAQAYDRIIYMLSELSDAGSTINVLAEGLVLDRVLADVIKKHGSL